MKSILFILLISLIMVSCTEETYIKLKDSSNKLIIEGEVTPGAGPHYVKLSRSVDFYSSNDYVPYNPLGYITISDDMGNIDTLTKVKDGVYKTNSLVGQVLHTYNLDILDSSTHYTASSFMNECPDIDSFYTWFFFNYEDRIPAVIITDPADVENYYRYASNKKGDLPNEYDVFEDRLINGSRWSLSSFTSNLEKGDTIEFTVISMDKANYNYWYVLQQNRQANSGGGANAAPSNPISNITNNALGYFSAHEVKRATSIVDF